MNQHEQQWNAIKQIRLTLVGLDSKRRPKYDKNAFRGEFRELREYARECGLSYYQQLFEAKEAYHREEYDLAHELACKARDGLLSGRKVEDCCCKYALRPNKNSELPCAHGRVGHCCFRRANPSAESLDRETLKDLPSAYGVIALAKLQLTIGDGNIAQLQDADVAIASALRVVVPSLRGPADAVFRALAGMSLPMRIRKCCGYEGSDRRNFLDIFVTACRILHLRFRLGNNAARPRNTLKKMLPANGLMIYEEGHPWLRAFAGDVQCTLGRGDFATGHYERILDCLEGWAPAHGGEQAYRRIREEGHRDNRAPHGSVYAAIRLSRLGDTLKAHLLDENNTLLDELRFDFDAIFWTAFEQETRFKRFLRHPFGSEEDCTKSSNLVARNRPAARTCKVKTERHPPQSGLGVQVNPEKSERSGRDVFCVLRSWSSFTPFLPQQWAPNRESRFTSRGGGYFLRWKGHGIAVDPGPSFIRNLYEAGFKIDDIDTIIVTHNHPDHTFEVPSLLNLASRARHNIENFLLSKNAKDVLERFISVSSKREALLFGPGDSWVLKTDKSEELEVKGLLAHHHDIGSRGSVVSAFGVAFVEKMTETARPLVVISSDTHWCNKVKRALEKDTKNAEIFVAHVSTVEFDQMLVPGEYYGKHLGVLGAFQALKTALPRIGVLSEWGEELVGYRAPIAAAIERALRLESPNKAQQRPRCIPGDRGLGFEFDPQDRQARVRCTFPRQRREFEECGELIDPANVVIDAHVDDGEHRIHYLCPEHRE